MFVLVATLLGLLLGEVDLVSETQSHTLKQKKEPNISEICFNF